MENPMYIGEFTKPLSLLYVTKDLEGEMTSTFLNVGFENDLIIEASVWQTLVMVA